MKKVITLFVITLVLSGTAAFAQTTVKEFKAGHEFYISLPSYMTRTMSLNSSAAYQWKSTVKDVYGFVIEDNKEELEIAEMTFTSLKEFYENFIGDFLKGQPRRKVSPPLYTEKGDVKYVECDVTYYDKDAKSEIYYLVGIVETKDSYYKILSWSSGESKEKFKADFQKIIYSLKD
jgi:hypothetical protein